ncbi:MAG: hypothetical protein IPL58_12330 [Betaproteobacteria bacterium]|uniref:Uncharacterized protein n=1 Tax=Candidatus Proximibacter danicus TaxID=2954365 RepID=A0A9D7K519_9PROT|nr:hypothetical protein [Candidatus Proximibacter danicus]
MRLTLGRAGVTLAATALITVDGGMQTRLSPHRLDSQSPGLRHKTTFRDLSDQELARAPAIRRYSHAAATNVAS